MLYLRATGTPYPVAIVGGTNELPETTVFDRWNQRLAVRAPKNALSLGAGG